MWPIMLKRVVTVLPFTLLVFALSLAQTRSVIKAKDILGLTLAEGEKLLGKPDQVLGWDTGIKFPGSRFYRMSAPLLRIINGPGGTGHFRGCVEFQFTKVKVKDWKTGALLLGLDPAKAKSKGPEWTWADLPGWRMSWNSPSFSGPRDPNANAMVFAGPEIGGEFWRNP